MAIKLTKRELHSQETRNNIIAAAAELFHSYGFDRVSVKDIAERAGVTTGAMYHHFKNKDDLMTAVLLDQSKSFVGLSKKFAKSDDPLSDLKWLLCEYMVQRVLDDGMEFTRHRVLKVFRCNNEDLNSCVKAIARRGLELGVFRKDVSEDDLCDLFTSIHRGAAYELCMSSSPIDLEQVTRRRLKLVLEGVVAR